MYGLEPLLEAVEVYKKLEEETKMSFRNKTGEALKNILESHGEDGAVDIIEQAIASKKIRVEDFSLKEIWEACTNGASVHESIASSAFPKITGALINAKLIAAYDGVATIGDQLVQTIPSNMQIETFAGFSDAETPEEVGEGDEYKDSTLSEKYVTAQNVKFGRMISVTEEMIYFDRTGQVMARAMRIGQKAKQYKERLILRAVMDLDTTVYRPAGVPTAFYSSTNGNLITSNAFGESGLLAVRVAASQMKDDSVHAGDDDFVLINLNNVQVIVPVDLEVQAWELANSLLTPEGAENAANFYKGRFQVLTSPYVTAQGNVTTWYWGDFKQDFAWVEVWPFQILTQRPGHEDEFKSDIKARVKVRFYGSPAALDVKHCFKSTA